jgi:hypothetical protein
MKAKEVKKSKVNTHMKKLIFILSLITAFTVKALESTSDKFSFVNDVNGYSYLKINSDMNSFTFQSDFKSIGNSGAVGFFKYADSREGAALISYINEYDAILAQYSKHVNNGIVSLGDVNAGDRIGFYLVRKNGDVIKNWKFTYKQNTAYITFLRNHGKDEQMSFGVVAYDAPAAGAPLPGSLAVIFIGGLLIAGIKISHKPYVSQDSLN